MTELTWVRSHVRLLLQDEWELCRVEVDRDGDVVYRSGTALCWVSVLNTDPIMVRVFAHAVYDIKSSAKLLRELNDIQNRALSARVTYDRGLIRVTQTICAVGLTGPALAQATTAVGALAGEIGPLLAPMFGGSTPYDVEADVESPSEDEPC